MGKRVDHLWPDGHRGGRFSLERQPWFITLKQAIAGWLIDHQTLWPLRLQPHGGS